MKEKMVRNPAAKLLAFYEGLRDGEEAVHYTRLETRKVELVSKRLRELEAEGGG